MSTSLYSNTPLVDESIIRIFSLHPASNLQDPVIGTLSAVSLAKKPTYQALSYTWGPPFDGQILEDGEITINGQPFLVAGNLLHALKRLRRAHNAYRLWIDQISIDQGSDDEKSHQVAMMAKIYQSASQVLIWLGEDSEGRDGEFVFRLMPAIRSRQVWSPKGWTHVGSGPPSQHLRYSTRAKRPFGSRKLENQQLGATDAVVDEKLKVFASRRYFKRRWVIQEIFHARLITFCCSGFRESWKTVYDGIYRVYDTSQIGPTIGQGVRKRVDRGTPVWILERLLYWSEWIQQKHQSDEKEIWTALRILIDYQHYECADPRDNIHALASLSCIREFPADYSSDLSTVYTRFVQWCMQYEPIERTLATPSSAEVLSDLLALAAYQAPHRTQLANEDLAPPSWVTDWRKEVTNVKLNRHLPLVEGARIYGRTLSARFGVCGTLLDCGLADGFEKDGLRFVDMSDRIHIDRYKRTWSGFCLDLQAGDIFCSPFCSVADYVGNCALVLRRNAGGLETFRVVGLCPTPQSSFLKAVGSGHFGGFACVVRNFDIE